MHRYAMVVMLAFLAAVSTAGAQNAAKPAPSPPPGAIRWDMWPLSGPPPVKPTGPAPPVYTLDVPMSLPQAIDVDEYGRFCVLDHIRQDIARFTPAGKSDKLWLEDTGHSCRAPWLFDMTVLSGERIYLGSHHWLPDVRRFGPDPEKTENLPGVEWAGAIAADENGDYFLYEQPGENRDSAIHAYSRDGKLKASWKTPSLQAMAIGPDGSIYAMANKELGIQIYDQKGRLQREIPLASLPISSPHQCRIAVDRNGDIYFTDSYGIVRLDAQGRPLARWLMYGGDRPLSGCDVAVRNGVVYVIAGYLGGEIQIFTPDGQCIARYVRPKLPLELPWAIAVQPDGSYAVEQAATPWPADSCLLFDAAGHQTGSIRGLMCSGFATRPAGGYYGIGYNGIKRVDASGENVVTIVGNQDVDGVFTQGAVDPATGNLWALSASKELVVFGPDDKLMKRVTLAKETDLSPREIFMAIDPSGFIYFSDVPKHHIVKCDFNGNVVGVIGKLGSGLGELRRPKGLTVDSEGRLIVADTRNHRIQAFSPDGTPLGVWGKLGHGEGELDRPTNVALSPDTLFIADTHNDRVVKVRLSDFWQEVSKDIKPAPPFVAPKKEPVPVPGEVTVEGIVVAGTDDFTDGIYIESADRAWGVKISLPEGARALQGQRCRVRGILELKERAARHLRARSIELVSAEMSALGPLGMANLYMGDGYRAGDRPTDLSNLGLLVKTWGRVISVDVANKCLVVNDGSYTGENAGLQVYAGNLRSPLAVWPDVGQYVGVTGISTSRPRGDGTFGPAIRVRGDDDIEIFAE